MQCKKIKKRLSSYLDKELPLKKMKTISEHLSHCLSCEKELQLLKTSDNFIASQERIEPSPFFIPKFLKRIEQEKEELPLVRLGLNKWFIRLITPFPFTFKIIFLLILGLFLGGGMAKTLFLPKERSAKTFPSQGLVTFYSLERFKDAPSDSFTAIYFELALNKRP